MPHPVNLLQLAYEIPVRVPGVSMRVSSFPPFERHLSRRDRLLKPNAEELASLKALVDAARAHGAGIGECDGFVFSFSIPHISKEFDLLKIAEHAVLNIELKSEAVGHDRILRQLRQNRYYLGHLKRPTRLFTYVANEGQLYELVGDELRPRVMPDLVDAMRATGPALPGDCADHFNPSDYLVSPADDTEAFLRGSYFLTGQQEEFKKAILRAIAEGRRGGFVVRGAAGTGKTLLLYDLAKELVARTGRDACVVHCGPSLTVPARLPLPSGTLHTVAPADLERIDLGAFSFVAFDEAHRVFDQQLQAALEASDRADVPFVVGIDSAQVLHETERTRDIDALVAQVIPPEHQFLLTAKIRTNESLVAFIRGFFDRRRAGKVPDGSVELSYATSAAEVRDLIGLYERRGYQAIYLGSPNDMAAPSPRALTVRSAIGREFEAVAIVVPDCFVYQGRVLCASEPAADGSLPDRLLYEAMTRAREKLALVFEGNRPLFETVLAGLSAEG